DQFLVAAEDKWGQQSGLVMLLPHGYEGQGPEHSSGRIERFLTLAAEDNIQVCNATTAAQYFHLLRRQVRRSGGRKPLIAFTPKSLLRAKESRSPVSSLETGSFFEVLDDPVLVGDDDAASAVTRVVLCSGKVAFDAMAARAAGAAGSAGSAAAVVRLEQLYPWPADALSAVLARYPSATEVVWLQEEPENMGAWTFVNGRLPSLLGEGVSLRHCSRVESGSPAAGSNVVHGLEQADIIERALG
ncbi:MAG: multifunctional 2-oxoglutarate metabolism enzyme, partial [Actinomycetota bacterium]|nr:multifunctional 2-oxoglutarate metabolism enzyme [Actinomycetota bacterium]